MQNSCYTDACGQLISIRSVDNMKRVRITISVDPEVYEFALAESRRKQMTLAQEFRHMMEAGYQERLKLEREYRSLRIEEMKYGR